MNDFLYGPPVPGAPWLAEKNPWSGQFPSLGPKSRPTKQMPFVDRAPQGERRLDRFTEQVSVLLNSLIGQGYLQQKQANVYMTLAGALVGQGPPTANTDTTIGAVVGCTYIDLNTLTPYICVRNLLGQALWRTAAGTTGPPGNGLPPGGTALQVLEKVDAADYNYAWAARRASLFGHGAPDPTLGIQGDTYIDLDSGNFYWFS